MAKYIDADALMNHLKATRNKYRYSDMSSKEIFSEIKAFPAADVEPMRKWILCSEQLPKYGETVLCLCENGGITVSCITYKGTKLGEAVWFGRHYVKAWMPLSILPKMDGGSE